MCAKAFNSDLLQNFAIFAQIHKSDLNDDIYKFIIEKLTLNFLSYSLKFE